MFKVQGSSLKSEPAEIAAPSDDWNILNRQIDHFILKGIRYVQGRR